MSYILTYTLYVGIASVLMGISTWKLYKKMGYNPIFAFIPFYNYYIILKETDHKKWWVVFTYFPVVGWIMMSVFHLFLMRKFGKDSVGQKVMTVVFSFTYLATVNYSKELHVLKNDEDDKKESMLGALTYAVVFASIIHTFITQPFTIPTASMERTLLVGDFLFVDKLSYGYRMPMRPLALPFLQNTLIDVGQKGSPKDDPKVYVEAVKLPYLRLPGWKQVQRNDIVVFNYPDDSVNVAIDRMDPYVKRCIAVAGDVLELKEGKLYINNKPEHRIGDAEVQQSYVVYFTEQLDTNQLWKDFGYLPILDEGSTSSGGYGYLFQGLTRNTVKQMKEIPQFLNAKPIIEAKGMKAISYFDPETRQKVNHSQSIFPIDKNWNQDWYGPIRIPKKGDILTLTKDNIEEYKRLISVYENNKLEIKNNKFFINDVETDKYTVQQNYYFMMGDNRDASLDSRFFGFVPEENIVGRPMFTWMSIQGMFDEGPFKIRWERMFKATNTGELQKTSYWWIAVAILVLFFGWDYFSKLIRRKRED